MNKNNLLKIQDFGQSIWLDYIDREMIQSGELKQLIEKDGLRGVTSNPSIFDKAIENSEAYEESIQALSREGKRVEEIYQTLTVKDVQLAADEFRRLHEASGGAHGFVSLEVNPHLAYRTEETIAEARELWRSLDRPNVFIKVPGTKEGLPAIRQLIGEGINVNVTLLFGLPRYREVAAAYISGLEERAAAGKPLDVVCSVASFFLSRIDVLVDPKLEEIAARGDSKAETAQKLRGQVAIASAKEAYQMCKEIFGQERFQKLAHKGGRPQRVLWASTSTKNPDYSDVKYVEALIGSETINTLPKETLQAYRDHGNPEERLEQGLEEARKVLESLPEVDIDIDQVTQQLEKEGVAKFNKPYDRLMNTLKEKRRETLGEKSQTKKAAADG
jgi:transaldolase